MATFGNNATPTATLNTINNYQYASGPFTMTENGTLTSVTFNDLESLGGFSTVACLWADNGGVPGALLATSTYQAVLTGPYTFPLSYALVSGQSYWFGFLGYSLGLQHLAGGVVTVADTSHMRRQANSEAPVDFTGSQLLSGTNELCVYGTYTPAAPSGKPGIRGIGSVLGAQGGSPRIVVASPGGLMDFLKRRRAA